MRVLLIEDDSATAQSIELMLKSESFKSSHPILVHMIRTMEAPDWPIASQTLRRSYSTDWFLASGTIGEALRPGQRLRCSEIQARGQSFRQRGQLV